MDLKPPAGRSLTFSMPEGMEGCGGNGRTRVVMVVGWAERREDKTGRLLGVTRIVMNTPRMAS